MGVLSGLDPRIPARGHRPARLGQVGPIGETQWDPPIGYIREAIGRSNETLTSLRP
jgi:hypothetical protein